MLWVAPSEKDTATILGEYGRVDEASAGHAEGILDLPARSDEFRGVAIKSMSGATGRQRVQKRCFDDLQIAQPPLASLVRVLTIAALGFRVTYKPHRQMQNLRRTRDQPLPRMLSGKVFPKEN